jgi:flagellar hook-length control protein FliK
MIALDLTKDASPSSSKLIVTAKEMKGEETLSFSKLLQGIKVGDVKELLSVGNKSEKMLLQTDKEGVSLKKDTKNSAKFSLNELLQEISADDLDSKNAKLQLLSKEDIQTLVRDLDFEEINPDIKSSLSESELKMLMKDAKDYLKKQILQTDGFKRSEVENLPKTLKGLTQVAQKYGVDISKITFEELQSDSLQKRGFLTLDAQKKVNIQRKTSAEDLKATPHKKSDTNTIPQTTSLLKVQQNSEISTEQIVSSKASHTQSLEQNNTKKRADETLKLLLQGEKAAKKESTGFTTDFSVATAEVIAPTQKGETSKLASLEALLEPENITQESTVDKSSAKTDGLNVTKADSFEIKLNEAKQMVKYLSQDVKQAIDNYKAPFTRLKVQLNPQQLGEVELTVVQRGKNLHVNLSSNNAAINALAMNANELKVQLQNSGINNASLNFSNNSQGGEQAASQQQQHNRQEAQNEYNYFEHEEINEEILSSLEIVVPNYA